MTAHENWVPGCGGTETPFQGRDGRTYLYMWNSRSGVQSEHAYYCQEDDLFLSNDEAARRIWGETR